MRFNYCDVKNRDRHGYAGCWNIFFGSIYGFMIQYDNEYKHEDILSLTMGYKKVTTISISLLCIVIMGNIDRRQTWGQMGIEYR